MESLGPYAVLGRIGTGGSADLLLAVRDGKRVVVKRMHPHLAEDDDYVRMFVAEAKVMSLLRHENIVAALDVDEAAHPTWFTMELVDGPNLAAVQRLLAKRGETVTRAVAVAVAARVAAALEHIHERGLVHRDVAAPNLLLSRDGEVKLTDFGVVKVKNKAFLASVSTQGGVLKGHLATMSPEQIRGAAVDARTDLYSLGVVLWEAIANRKLWEGTPLELVEKIANDAPLPLVGETAALTELVQALLEKDPAARPASATVVKEILRSLGPATSSEVADVVRSLGVPSLAS